MPEVITERFVLHERVLCQLLSFTTTNMTLGLRAQKLDGSQANLEAIRKPASIVVHLSSSDLAVMKFRVTAWSKSVQHQIDVTNLDHGPHGSFILGRFVRIATEPHVDVQGKVQECEHAPLHTGEGCQVVALAATFPDDRQGQALTACQQALGRGTGRRPFRVAGIQPRQPRALSGQARDAGQWLLPRPDRHQIAFQHCRWPLNFRQWTPVGITARLTDQPIVEEICERKQEYSSGQAGKGGAQGLSGGGGATLGIMIRRGPPCHPAQDGP